MTPINPILLSEVKRRYGYVPVVLQDPLMESDVSSKVSRTSYSFSSNELRLRLKSFLSFVAKNEAKNRKVLLHCYHGYGASNNLALAYKYVKGVETFWYKDTFYSSKKISLKELKGM
ncbi:MAG: hypothetical protein NTY48_02050 [Candidatus Diapherotrites archaeon]|nr:hypothetical protein [Candidatus Diapherotrites archaeon]